MAFLIKLLNNYLKQQVPINHNKEYHSIFNQEIIKEDVVTIST